MRRAKLNTHDDGEPPRVATPGWSERKKPKDQNEASLMKMRYIIVSEAR